MIINEEFVNQHCQKKLGFYNLDIIKDEEEIIIDNQIYVYVNIIKNYLPNNLKKLVFTQGLPLCEEEVFNDECLPGEEYFFGHEITKNLPLTLEELDLKDLVGEIKVSLPNLKKINASGIKLLGFYEKLEEANLKEMKEIPDTLRKLKVDIYDNDSKNIEELELKEFKGGTLGEKLKKFCSWSLEVKPNIFEKCCCLTDLTISNLKNIDENTRDIFQNLKKLFISNGDYKILDYLPKNLEELSFCTGLPLNYYKSFPKIELSNLPSSLKKLKLGRLKSNLNFLPPITKLDLYYVNGKFTNLPSSIEKFYYEGPETEINLPDNIDKSINISAGWCVDDNLW